MAVIEGYAEHVMDAAAAGDPRLGRAARPDGRAAGARGGLGDIIARLLGLGMKLRQYELGKAWSDAVAAEAGIAGLNRVWESPASLPALRRARGARRLARAGWPRRPPRTARRPA